MSPGPRSVPGFDRHRAPRPPPSRGRAGAFVVGEVALPSESLSAVVTGAGSGIGRATAVGLAKIGARVALVGRDAGKLEGTKELVGRDDTLVEPCDVADRA